MDVFDQFFCFEFSLKIIRCKLILKDIHKTRRSSYDMPYLDQNFWKNLRKTVNFWIFGQFFNIWGRGAARRTQNFENS
jgi:hypothetical protein